MSFSVGSKRSLHFSSAGAFVIALTTLACSGFEVPAWTRPGGLTSARGSTEPLPATPDALGDDDGGGGSATGVPPSPSDDDEKEEATSEDAGQADGPAEVDGAADAGS